MSIDGLANVAIRPTTGVEFSAGDLVGGSIYVGTYKSAMTYLLIHGHYADPSPLPAGIVMAWSGGAAPLGWLLCYGQAVSRTTYAGLFASIGTQYGAGDGSTTFGIPDLRGRVIAGVDDMGGSAAGRLTSGGSGINGTIRGAAGGAQSIALSEDQMPSHRHFGTTDSGTPHAHSGTADEGFFSSGLSGSSSQPLYRSGGGTPLTVSISAESAHTHTFATGFAGGSGPHINVQPTMVLHYVIKT